MGWGSFSPKMWSLRLFRDSIVKLYGEVVGTFYYIIINLKEMMV